MSEAQALDPIAVKLLELVNSAPSWAPDDAVTDEPEKGLAHSLADLICADNHFAQDVGGKLFRYVDGAYRSKADAFIRARVKALCITLGCTKQWSRRLADEVVEFIRVDCPELWDRPPLDVVNVANGLLRLADGVLLPHSPKHLSPVQLPVAYDPAATCKAIAQFINDVFPPDAVDLGFEIVAFLMTPDASIQKAVLLLGSGGNGKSAYLAMLLAFLGRINTSSVTLHRLESDRFSAARLLGKLANIFADLPTEHLEGTSTFKALTGGDSIEAEHKFRDSFSFIPYARLLFSANSPPKSNDGSEGFFDRWLVVPFEGRFRGTASEVSRKVLDARLSDPAELSGLLNQAMAAWQRIQARGGRLAEPESVRQAWQEFHAMTDPLSVWLDQFTIDDAEAVVAKRALRAAYGAACESAGRPSPTDNRFGRDMRKARPNVSTAQRTINGRLQWCFVGIGLAGDDSRHSQDSQEHPLLVVPTNRTREEVNAHGGIAERGKQDRANPVNPVNRVNGQTAVSGDPCPRCGGREAVDSPLPNDRGVRRDCASCGRTIGFPAWAPTNGHASGGLL